MVTILAVLFAAYFLRGYFKLVVIAAVLAYLFTPLYNFYKKRLSTATAATITLLTSFIVVIVPLVVVGFLTVEQLRQLADTVSDRASNLDIGTLGSQIIDSTNSLLQKLPFGDYSISEAAIIEWGKNGLSRFSSSAVGYLTGVLGSVFGILSAAIVYIYLFMAFLVKGPKLVTMFRAINPLGHDISNIYLKRSGAMVRGTVKGQFVIAVAQGAIGALTLAIGGLSQVFFIMFVTLTLLSIIPLGGGILVIPVGLFMMLFGNIGGGILVIVGHLLVTSNIDSVLRPKLIPKEARLDSALMLISVFSGIAMFGFLGIVLGPTLMILVVTTIEAYLEVHKGYTEEVEPKKAGFFKKMRQKKQVLTTRANEASK